MRTFLLVTMLSVAFAASGCYNAGGTHACVCGGTKDACTGTWTSGCDCDGEDPPSPPQAACSEETHHKENGGYYIEGIAGVDNADRRESDGLRADKIEWVAGKYYPHAEMKLCTGPYCTEASRTVGEAQYVYAHTCAKLRFSYAADSGSTVYLMKNKTTFDMCDFDDGATLVGAADKGMPHYDYKIESDHEKTEYYFASKTNCSDGHKVAVTVSDDYTANYEQCEGMGGGSSRIQHCDCDHHLRGTTLINPCHAGFVAGCTADMPADLSCCPGSDASYDSVSRAYVNGGQCIPKSKLSVFQDRAKAVYKLMTCNKTEFDEMVAMDECPKTKQGYYMLPDPECAMVKEVARCDVVSPAAGCAKDMEYKVYVETIANLGKPVCPAGSVVAEMVTVTTSFTLSGTISELDAVRNDIKKVVATGAGVKPSTVSIRLAAGSVIVTATISVTDADAAAAVTTALTEGVMKDAMSLETALKAGGVSVTVESAPIMGAPGGGSGTIIIIIIVAALAAVIVVALVVMKMKKGGGGSSTPAKADQV